MFYHKLLYSSELSEAVEAFYQVYAKWVRACVKQYQPFHPSNAPKQTAIVRAWATFLRTQHGRNADCEVVELVASMRNKISLHLGVSGLWKQGYWAFANVIDGTFYFEHFLKLLWEIDPDADAARQPYLTAAQYLGNWDPDVPDWFNWETGLFYSYFMGTESVLDDAQFRVNVVEQWRLLGMALTAFQMSGEARYLDLAKLYGSKWTQAILAEQALPVGLSQEGPVYSLNGPTLEAYNHFVGETTTLQDDLERAENFLVNDAIRILLELWQLTDDSAYHAAAIKLLDILVTQLSDPDAGIVAAAIRQYRTLTESNRYDDLVMQQVELSIPYGVDTIAVETMVERDLRPYGVGKARFLPVWFENNYPRQYSPILLGLAAEISGDERLATQALDLARGYFVLAHMAFDNQAFDGHLHAQSMVAIAAGHSRDNGTGMITAVLEPLSGAAL